MGKGYAAERELSDRLEDEHGFAAMPAGGSGSGTDRARPDVFAARRPSRAAPGGERSVLAIEVKAWANGTGRLDSDEIQALRGFATRAGGTPLVAVRPDLRTWDRWHVYTRADLHRTGAGNYSVRQPERPGRSLAEVVDDD